MAGLGDWVPLGKNVVAASVHMLPDGGMATSYIDGGVDMEVFFDVSQFQPVLLSTHTLHCSLSLHDHTALHCPAELNCTPASTARLCCQHHLPSPLLEHPPQPAGIVTCPDSQPTSC
jgi:hypothetical protein